MNWKWYIVFLFCAVQWFSAHAQENMGIANSNYAPLNTIFLNPTSSADSKAFIDFNFTGVSIHALNNYAHLNQGIGGLNSGGELEVLYDQNEPSYFAYTDVQVHGPALSLSMGKFGAGLFMNVRSVTSVNGITNHLAQHAINGFDFEDQLGNEYTTNNLQLGSLAWLEYGANFSYIIHQEGRDMITVGGNLKYLNGIAGAGLNIQEWNYQVANDSVLNSFEFRGNYALPAFNEDIEGASDVRGNGSGLGLDLGFSYKKMKKSVSNYRPHTPSDCELKDYQYRFGVSLLDVGRIRMKEGYVRDFNVDDPLIWEDYNGADPDGLEEIDELINQELAGRLSDNRTESYRLALPTALSMQFDYNVGKGFYANASIVHGFFRRNRLGVQRNNTFAITPRYERRQVEVALPMTLQNYQFFRMGAALRVYSVIIGTDNLTGLLGLHDRVRGADFYFSLKYTMFRPWYCKDKIKKSKSKRRRGKGGPPCPSW